MDPGSGVDLDALFAPPTGAEIEAVRADWAVRDVTPADVNVEAEEPFALGLVGASLRVVSHAIDGGRHYGAVIVPDGAEAGSLPVVVYAHEGDQGVDTAILAQLGILLGDALADFVWVVPSFRAETLRTSGGTWRSGGLPSPWDRDVDDALSFLDAALGITPEADPERLGVLGLSRGAGVALLMGVRDERIDRIVEFFGPTDFFGPYVQEIVGEAIEGVLRDLPGLVVLDERFIQPMVEGVLTPAEVRRELVRRSAVLFASDLPVVQIHHGEGDDIVDVSQADALAAALEALDRGPPDDEFFRYESGGHNPLTLAGSVDRAIAFLGVLTEP
jgi:dipeptidyl aminopeptidase/acylaminoacyl peptidase